METGLRWDVWRELAFEQRDLVFQKKLALLQSLQLKLVLDWIL